MTSSVHPVLEEAAAAAQRAYQNARRSFTRAELENIVGNGADGTPTMFIDQYIEQSVVETVAKRGVNLLSEELGFVDQGSHLTVVADPLDGSANAAADVPLSCFSAALADERTFIQSITVWFETGRSWRADASEPSEYRTTGQTSLSKAAVSMLRPHAYNRESWLHVADRADRVRILSCSTLEACLVAQGSTDAFVDAGSDTHRLCDLAAALVLVPATGGVVIDAKGRPIEFDVDLTRRWSGIVAASPALAEELALAINQVD
ncbi:MAG TPA: inositol monophosphatase family protein [Acidimicrobiales bacterium]|nr:inositol monophosphatase family protein [Acidimicrobiales bacterium]